jgi:hypothetical protein
VAPARAVRVARAAPRGADRAGAGGFRAVAQPRGLSQAGQSPDWPSQTTLASCTEHSCALRRTVRSTSLRWSAQQFPLEVSPSSLSGVGRRERGQAASKSADSAAQTRRRAKVRSVAIIRTRCRQLPTLRGSLSTESLAHSTRQMDTIDT